MTGATVTMPFGEFDSLRQSEEKLDELYRKIRRYVNVKWGEDKPVVTIDQEDLVKLLLPIVEDEDLDDCEVIWKQKETP